MRGTHDANPELACQVSHDLTDAGQKMNVLVPVHMSRRDARPDHFADLCLELAADGISRQLSGCQGARKWLVAQRELTIAASQFRHIVSHRRSLSQCQMDPDT